MDTLERLDIIEHLAEINISCEPNLLDIKHHIEQIKQQLSSLPDSDCNHDYRRMHIDHETMFVCVKCHKRQGYDHVFVKF